MLKMNVSALVTVCMCWSTWANYGEECKAEGKVTVTPTAELRQSWALIDSMRAVKRNTRYSGPLGPHTGSSLEEKVLLVQWSRRVKQKKRSKNFSSTEFPVALKWTFSGRPASKLLPTMVTMLPCFLTWMCISKEINFQLLQNNFFTFRLYNNHSSRNPSLKFLGTQKWFFNGTLSFELFLKSIVVHSSSNQLFTCYFNEIIAKEVKK